MLHVLLCHLRDTINLKQYIMKKLIYLLSLSLLVCMSCSKDGLQVENEVANEMYLPDYQNTIDRIQMEIAKSNENGAQSRSSGENENNGNGVKIVAFYSNGGFWTAQFPVFDKDGNLTHFFEIAFPQNGEDRALVFNDTEMMVNFTSHDPQMYLVDLRDGQVYSNWCEEDRSGIYTARGKTGYASLPGNPDVYWWGPNSPTTGDDNYIFHIKATLSPIFGSLCDTDLTESIDFSYTFQGQNGEIRQTSSIK